MNNLTKLILSSFLVLSLAACGAKVEVPPAHVGKIMTKDGYQENLVPPSKFRLSACFAYCDRLILLDTSDKTVQEPLEIFIPEDKLNLNVGIQATLSLNPNQTESLFGTLQPSESNGVISTIRWESIYDTYAKQIILTETREYISKYSIAEIASSLEKVNADLRVILQDRIKERTPFTVRYVGITNVKYPDIITAAQENAAERRERIQQEEAQLNISKVTLERELQETRLKRQIELEKAEIEAQAQRIQREVVDEKVLALRRLENERLMLERWNGTMPETVVINGTDSNNGILLNMLQKQGK